MVPSIDDFNGSTGSTEGKGREGGGGEEKKVLYK